jgi:hypothetical protein
MIAISDLRGGWRRGGSLPPSWRAFGTAGAEHAGRVFGSVVVVVAAGLAHPSIREIPVDFPATALVGVPRGVRSACSAVISAHDRGRLRPLAQAGE